MKQTHWAVALLTVATPSLLGIGNTLAASPTFSEEQICKAGIASIMGRSPATMRTTKKDQGIVYFYYVRKNDGAKWSYRCKLDGARIIWASDTGRWRNDPRDEVISYRVNDGSLEIIQSF
ncbi:hypothetical protein, partial [Thiobacillus sp.]